MFHDDPTAPRASGTCRLVSGLLDIPSRAGRGRELGEYTGKLKTLPAGCMALSSDGEHVVVYFCDGADTHPPTVSHWMRGEIVSGSVRIAADGFTLVALWQLQGRRATGTLTLPKQDSPSVRCP